eukprot:Pgem_evm1s15781
MKKIFDATVIDFRKVYYFAIEAEEAFPEVQERTPDLSTTNEILEKVSIALQSLAYNILHELGRH